MRMHIAAIWGSLVLLQTTLVQVGSQYVHPFYGQRAAIAAGGLQQLQPQQPQQQSQQPQPQQQNEPGYSGKRASAISEPTCEELRAMWRYSKRQNRAAENTNELPVYRDPFSYNVWEAYPSRPPSTYSDDYTGPARSRSSGAPIYGKVVHKAPAGSRLRNGMPDKTRAFEEVARLYGTITRHPSQRRRLASHRISGGGVAYGPPQSGSFQHLKELIINERARELQEQRRAEEIAARAAVLKEMTYGDSKHEFRNPNHLSSLQSSYQDPRAYEFAQLVGPESSELGQRFSKSERFARDYVLRR